MAKSLEQIEWLSLVNISGPFLANVVLEETFPQGIEPLATPARQRLRRAHEEWREIVEKNESDLDLIHKQWVKMVLTEALEYEESDLIPGDELGDQVVYQSELHGGEVEPQFAIKGPDRKLRLLIAVHSPDTPLDKPLMGDSWPVSPAERMTLLCRKNEIRTGLVTNGEEWMLVNAPIGSTSGYATWYARIWWQEPVTFKAFSSLLSVRRCFGPAEESLCQLLERSTEFHEEVTNTLGEQVRRAVEVLVQAVGRADQDSNGELLKDVQPQELYEAGLTVMMRLVFVFCAEERDLLLLGDPSYDQYYAVSNLRAQLREDANQHGPEVLEKRYDAWSRLLTVFRMIYGGVEHESLRLPALGGSLFDPDRFPFLEGRAHGTSWQDTTAPPLPIDNRTVLLLLRALQVLEHRGGAQLLSYRGLDVEQIGHVYEGLLEYTVDKIDGLTIGLTGSKKVPNPMVTLAELEEWQGATLAKKLAERTDRSLSVIKNALKREPDETDLPALIQACEGDEETARKLLPYVSLIRKDSWGSLMIYHAGTFAVVPGEGRRETGAHYTPKALTEPIVQRTLEPVVYIGPAEGHPKEKWQLKSPAELLNLKLCDPAMGSGAFLVQSCRYLADRLVQSWATAEEADKVISIKGEVLDSGDEVELMPQEMDDRLITAYRLVSEHCLYGVDKNPMAVELAKLSIWLLTLQKGRPFGFLDHKLKSGDSLVGLTKAQITSFTWKSDTPAQIDWLEEKLKADLEESFGWRKSIGEIGEFEHREKLDVYQKSESALTNARLIGDLCIAAFFNADKDKAREELRGQYRSKVEAWRANAANRHDLEGIVEELRSGEKPVPPLHWEIEFPEVFGRGNPGFDAMVGNPPFAGKNTIAASYSGSILAWLKSIHGTEEINHVVASADLVAHFFRRCFQLLREAGCFGLIATNTVAQGATRRTGLSWISRRSGFILRAERRIAWPGAAAVIVSVVHIGKHVRDNVPVLDGESVDFISPFLLPIAIEEEPYKLLSNIGLAFKGVEIGGKTLLLQRDEMLRWQDLLRPDGSPFVKMYVGGQDFNKNPKVGSERYLLDTDGLDAADLPAEIKSLLQSRVERWDSKVWQFRRPAKQLRTHFLHHRTAIAISRVQTNWCVSIVKNTTILSESLVVVASDKRAAFGLFQSRVHEEWMRLCGSSLKDDLRYTPSDCSETFPFPEDWQTDPTLEAAGKTYYEFRAELMVRNDEGLTKTYNRFHDPDEDNADILKLRELHAAMDRTVLDAYGWDDISTDCEFIADYEVEEGKKVPWRYRWPEEVHDEVLARLLDLNQKRHEEESNQSQPSKKKSAGNQDKKDPEQIKFF